MKTEYRVIHDDDMYSIHLVTLTDENEIINASIYPVALNEESLQELQEAYYKIEAAFSSPLLESEDINFVFEQHTEGC